MKMTIKRLDPMTYDVMYREMSYDLSLKTNRETLNVIWEATTCSIGIMMEDATDIAPWDMMEEEAAK